MPSILASHSSAVRLLQMTKLFDQHSDCCIVAIEETPMTEVDKYGVIDGNLLKGSNNADRVDVMVEKLRPEHTPTNLTII